VVAPGRWVIPVTVRTAVPVGWVWEIVTAPASGESSLSCVDDVGANYGFADNIDVCESG